MQRSDFHDFMNEVWGKINQLNYTKGNDYSGSEDAFANFKRNAKRLSLTPKQVWAVYFFKHMDAIETYLRDGAVKSEPIEGRIDDAILYLFLLRGMIHEEKETPPLVELKSEDDLNTRVKSTQELMDHIRRTTAVDILGPVGNFNNPHVIDGSVEWELTSTGWVRV